MWAPFTCMAISKVGRQMYLTDTIGPQDAASLRIVLVASIGIREIA
jgi:hypothetical protein